MRPPTANRFSWAVSCRLTVHSSRTRFAGRLNSGVRGHMKRCVAVAIIVLAGCTDSVATDCSTHVVGTWKSTIPAVDDAGNARPTPVLELVVRYKEDKTFVSL